MKKLTKLNLSDLKVESFVTSLEDKDSQTVKGGSSQVCSVIISATVVSHVLIYVAKTKIKNNN